MVEKDPSEAARKLGDRKRKSAAEKPRKVMAFRVNHGLNEKLEASSRERGFSLSEEIEFRLEQSFREGIDPYIDSALRLGAASCHVIQSTLGTTITDDEFTRVACAKALVSAVDLVGSLVRPGEHKSPHVTEILRTGAEDLGRMVTMFVQAKASGVESADVKTLGEMADAAMDRRLQDVEEARHFDVAVLARLLRGSSAAAEQPFDAPAPEAQPADPAAVDMPARDNGPSGVAPGG